MLGAAEIDGLLEGLAVGDAEGLADGEAEGCGEIVGEKEGDADGAAVGISQLHGSSGATSAAVCISKHSDCVYSKFRPRTSNSPHCIPPIVAVSKVGSPVKHTEQNTVCSGNVGGGVDVGPPLSSPGQPHVSIANACAMPHCSNVNPSPNGPPMNCACPQVTPNPFVNPGGTEQQRLRIC